MTKFNDNKISYISLLVQNKVLNGGGGYYLLTNLKEENFLHEING